MGPMMTAARKARILAGLMQAAVALPEGSNPAHRVMAAIGAPYGWTRQPSAPGVAKRRAKRKAQRLARKGR